MRYFEFKFPTNLTVTFRIELDNSVTTIYFRGEKRVNQIVETDIYSYDESMLYILQKVEVLTIIYN